ncbi:hypothetical protein VPH49_24500 [Pseudomonas luteola]|uniref:Uncharacterized protein n=2 Tax=Pseudomonas TaxID=286 RepID=A0ABS0MYA7_PSELU|nr:hypothetical protein [Pseudomonas luteola]MBH3441440.1 hypothetical protein [Pseudomonas luteola]QEU26615.1 hypothetical protein FOB45_02020 [Pseudomonas luteola]
MYAEVHPDHGIVRNQTDDGWYVLPVRSGESPRAFFDAAYDFDPGASYIAAKAYNDALRPYTDAVRHYRNQRSDKGRPDLPVGITLATRKSVNRGGKGSQLLYSFKISTLRGKPVNVYIGTANTWETNFAKALERAVAIRERSREALLKPAHANTARA